MDGLRERRVFRVSGWSEGLPTVTRCVTYPPPGRIFATIRSHPVLHTRSSTPNSPRTARNPTIYITTINTPPDAAGATRSRPRSANSPQPAHARTPPQATQGRTAPPTCRRWTGGPAADAGHLQPPHSGCRKATAYTIKPGAAPGSAHRPPAQRQPGHDPPPRTSSRPPATPGSAPPTLDTAHAAQERPQQARRTPHGQRNNI